MQSYTASETSYSTDRYKYVAKWVKVTEMRYIIYIKNNKALELKKTPLINKMELLFLQCEIESSISIESSIPYKLLFGILQYKRLFEK